MIEFQREDPGLRRIEDIITRKKEGGGFGGPGGRIELLDTLYVFGANRERAEFVYVSPAMPQLEQVVRFLNGHGVPVAGEAIGNPPWNNWVAFHRRMRDNSPEMCARICMFLEFCINNQVVW